MTNTVFFSCDEDYYNDWGINLIRSIQHYNPWMNIHAHVVNPKKLVEMKQVIYTTETKKFYSESERISYLQCSRFLAVPKYYPTTELVMAIDADTICTQSSDPDYFKQTAEHVSVLKHHKNNNWLAGLVTFGENDFRHVFAKKILETNIWEPGHDQKVLRSLSEIYDYKEPTVSVPWMKQGISGYKGIFFTLKGEQKIAQKYRVLYNEQLRKIK